MILEKVTTASSQPVSTGQSDEMRIAWRYNTLDKVDSEQGGGIQRDGNNSYTFDLSQSVEDGAFQSYDITLFGKDENSPSFSPIENSVFHNPAYVSLIQKLKEKLNEPAFETNSQQLSTETTKNLLRICIESLGSPLWYDNHFTEDFCLFLIILKAALRVLLSVCCLTIPTHLFKHIVSEKQFK